MGGSVSARGGRESRTLDENYETCLETVCAGEGVLSSRPHVLIAFEMSSYRRAISPRGMLLYDFGNEEELVSQLNTALFNPASEDTSVWADRYRREAQENLQAVLKGPGC